MISNLPETLSPNQYAEITGRNPRVVRRHCANGTIPAQKVGRCWVIPRDLCFKKLLEKEAECMK